MPLLGVKRIVRTHRATATPTSERFASAVRAGNGLKSRRNIISPSHQHPEQSAATEHPFAVFRIQVPRCSLCAKYRKFIAKQNKASRGTGRGFAPRKPVPQKAAAPKYATLVFSPEGQLLYEVRPRARDWARTIYISQKPAFFLAIVQFNRLE